VGLIARECLANGLLVKSPESIDWSRYTSSPEERAQRESQLGELRARATAEGRPLAALAVDYARELDGVSVTLLGASSREQLVNLLAQVRLDRAR
jgi:aryl-alcohol dehydrogenase-like predicted oxidoreductase